MKKRYLVFSFLIICMVMCWCSSALAAIALTVGDRDVCSFNHSFGVGYSVTSCYAYSSNTCVITVTDCTSSTGGMGSVTVKAVGAGKAEVTVYVTAYYGKWDSVLGYWREDTQTRTSTYSFEVSAASTGGSSSGGSSSSSTPVPSSGICGPMVDFKFEDGVLTIYGTGEMFDYSSDKPAPWGQTAVSQVIVKEGVTGIGDYAFYKNSNLTSITLPSTLEKIGKCAFDGCNKIYAIRMPDGITEIGASAFRGCTALTYANIPVNLETLGPSAFKQCALQTVTIPASVTRVQENTFAGCNDLTSVTIQGDLSAVAIEAFSGCKRLKSVKINGDVGTICWLAFSDCTSLESVEIKGSLNAIIDEAFKNCTKLKKIVLPKELNDIGDLAFRGSNPTIYCYRNSYADEFAQRKGLTIVYLDELFSADVNNDGTTDVHDVLRLLQYSAGWNVEVDTVQADVNGDAVWDVKDVIKLLEQMSN